MIIIVFGQYNTRIEAKKNLEKEGKKKRKLGKEKSHKTNKDEKIKKKITRQKSCREIT